MERTSIFRQAALWLALTRPLNLSLALLSVIVVSWLVGLNDLFLIWSSSFSVLMITAAGNMLNDVKDIETDRINRPGRPLVSNRLPLGLVSMVWKLMMSAGLVVSAVFLPAEATGLALLNAFLLIWYSSGLKGTPLIGNLVVSWLLASVFLFTGLVAGAWTETLYPALVVFCFSLPRELAKDACDEPGDRLAGFGTFPVRMGLPLTRIILFVLVLVAAFSGLVPVWSGAWGTGFLYLYLMVVVPVMIFILILVGRASLPSHFRLPASLLKVVIVPALAALIAGKLW
ncbi:MAG: geranylgeranylglycerol-phosphate geranylgeranyltransferase [Bacteroidetes bacterium]|nr:geranylgeranylglycerol-phosphate geranylgeranyltransferase [Bacteroidota bacterium]